MSAQAECPLCGYCSKNVAVPDSQWGDVIDQVKMEEAIDDGGESDPRQILNIVHDNILRLGKTVFWCRCGRMIWMEGTGWLVSLPFIERLAEVLRDAVPHDYRQILAALAVAIPDDIARVKAALEKKKP